MYCPFCGSQNNPSSEACAFCGISLRKPADGPAIITPDWEIKGHILNAVSFLITVRDVLFEPVKTFRHLKSDNAIFNALLFALLGATIGGATGAFWQFLVQTSGIWDFLMNSFGVPLQNVSSSKAFGPLGNMVAAVFIIPVFTAMALFLMSALFHFLLKVLGGAHQGFSTTFKVYAYAQGATSLLGVIPFCGALTGAAWFICLVIIGLKEAHRTTYPRSLAAVLLPVLFCCSCVVAVIVAVMVSGLGMAYLLQYAR